METFGIGATAWVARLKAPGAVIWKSQIHAQPGSLPDKKLWGEQNHRIIESFGSEGTPRGHLVQPPCSEQEHH